MINQIYRKVALQVAGMPLVEQFISNQGKGLAARYIAGDDVQQAIVAIQKLQQRGIWHNLDLLGEFVDDAQSANQNAQSILDALDALHEAGIKPYNSVKMSALGQGQNAPDVEDLGYVNTRRIVERAKQYSGFVNLDMEDHTRVDSTLQIFRRLVEEFGNQHVGTVLQAYLHRTEADRASLDDLKPNIRIVKGAYLEPATVAMQDKAEIDAAYRRLVYAHLKAGNYTNVATHDHNIMYDVQQFVVSHGISRDAFEFQLLYGVRENLQDELVGDGYRVRSYIPFGTEWYGYYSRRIAEKPANALFVLRGMVGG